MDAVYPLHLPTTKSFATQLLEFIRPIAPYLKMTTTTTVVGEPADGVSASTKDGREYWDGIDADVNGMLGGIPSVVGYAHISKVDLQSSRSFLAKLGIGSKNGRHKIDNALEGGAGFVSPTAVAKLTPPLISADSNTTQHREDHQGPASRGRPPR